VSAGEAASAEDLPPTAEVVAELQRAVRDPERRSDPGLLGLLVDLLRSNLEQWNLESRSRGAGVDDAAVALTKRAIDYLNGRRHQLVEAIDAMFDRALAQTATAPLATESPGMAFDRLSVLVIRVHRTELAAGEGAPDAGVYAARLPVLHRQLADLEQAIDGLVDDVRAGRRRFALYQSLKLYGN
jgi:Protein of unknown function (DUF4254)